jgi:membrane protease YdiL (CAAX protease family)
MQFLVDPSEVRLGVASILFLVVVCVLLPIAAVRQHRHLMNDEHLRRLLSRPRIYMSAFATHAVLLAIAWAVLREQRLDLFPSFRPTVTHTAIALAALALGLLPVLDRFRLRDPVADERTRFIAPRTRRDHVIFAGVAISAGFSEELVYRGVLFILLASVLDSWWMSAAVAGVAFGVAHSFQGWKSSGIAALIGVRDQIVVGLTGTLIYAMLIHTLHDVIAGAVLGRRVRREEAAAAGEGGAALATS